MQPVEETEVVAETTDSQANEEAVTETATPAEEIVVEATTEDPVAEAATPVAASSGRNNHNG